MSVSTFESLLNEVSTKYNELRKNGEFFNIFSAVNIQNDERKHSRFIANLLDPKGSHGQKDLFLDLFVDVISINEVSKKYDELKSVKKHVPLVEIEKNLGIIDDDYNCGGFIDIAVNINHNYQIAIENKINAGDQKNQLYRYKNSAKRPVLLYLTKFGSDPSPESTKGLEKDKDFFCISYQITILTWVEKCIEAVRNKEMIRESLKNYKNAIEEITLGGNMGNEMVNKIIKSPDSVESAFLINNLLHSVKKTLMRDLENQIKIEADKLNYKMISSDDFGKKGQELRFISNLRKNKYTVCIGFDKDYDEYFIGVIDDSIGGVKKNKKKSNYISASLNHIGLGKPHPFYYYLLYQENLTAWDKNVDIWKGIKTGQTVKEIISKVKEIMDIVCEINI